MKISKEFEFEAAHVLPWHKGQCGRMHGHSYKLQVDVAGPIDGNGVVVDFSELSAIVKKEIVDKYDHQLLNDFFENPTAEIMCTSFLEKIRSCWTEAKLPAWPVAARLWETRKCYVEAT